MGIVESGRCDTAFNSVSMSRVKDVEVGAGIDVVEVHGVVGADGQGVGASVGKEGGVCPGVVRGRDFGVRTRKSVITERFRKSLLKIFNGQVFRGIHPENP